MEKIDEIDKMSVCLQHIWNGNELYCFKPFGMEIDKMEMNVSNYLE